MEMLLKNEEIVVGLVVGNNNEIAELGDLQLALVGGGVGEITPY